MAGKRKEALTNFNRSNIIQTAERLFTQIGIVQTTMDDIAKEADYSKSTIYAYFKSKDEIYHYIIYHYMMQLKEDIKTSVEQFDDAEECFYAICNNLVQSAEKNPLYLKSILGKINVEQADLDASLILTDIYNIGEEINQIVMQFLENGIKNGKFDSTLNPLQTTFTIWGSICGVIVIADQKEQYFEKILGTDKKEFLKSSFKTLLQSIINHETTNTKQKGL